jgi:hypothetical protein
VVNLGKGQFPPFSRESAPLSLVIKYKIVVCQKVFGVLNNLQKFRDVHPEQTRLIVTF